ncbi:neopullulanase [Vibrio sp. JCM 19236]|nr:neopullulanase [Vibrio sp. JCM 19236]
MVLWIGDPYHWAEGGLDGGNLGGSEAHGWVGGNEVKMELEGQTEHHDHWFAEFTPPKRRTRYGFILEGKDGEKIIYGEKRVVDIRDPKVAEAECSNISNFFCFPYLNPRDVLDTPKWVEKTVWYQIFLSVLLTVVLSSLLKGFSLGAQTLTHSTSWAVTFGV